MKNKTKCFAVATAVLLAFCLVFMMPVGAEDLYVYPYGSAVEEGGYASLEAAILAANEGDTIILKSGDHYANGPQDGTGASNQISINVPSLTIKGEDADKSVYHIEIKDSNDDVLGRGLDVVADSVTFSDFIISVSRKWYGEGVVNPHNKFTMDNCKIVIDGDFTGAVPNLFDDTGNYEVKITDSQFISNADTIFYTVYLEKYDTEHTSLLTFTGNIIEGNFYAGLVVNGNYKISRNNFNINNPNEDDRDGKTFGVKVYANNVGATSGITGSISGNTFGENVDSVVCILPYPENPVCENKIPTFSENILENSEGHLLEVALSSYFSDTAKYSFATMPVTNVEDTVYSYGYPNNYNYIGEFEAGVTPLVPGVNLPGSTWTGDAENGYTLTFTEDGTYKLMDSFAVQANGISIPSGKMVTVDINDRVISASKNEKEESSAVVVNKGTLIIKDSIGGGKITSAFNNPDLEWAPEGFPTYATNTIKNEGTLTIKSGTIESMTSGGASYAIDNYQYSTLTVGGGTITGAPNNVAIRVFANGVDANKPTTTVTINGGEITGKRAIWIQLPNSCYSRAPAVELKITGGTLTSTGYVSNGEQYYDVIYSYTYGESFENTKIIIEDGIFNGDVAFSGGLSKQDQQTADHKCLEEVKAKALETVTVSGGTFNGGIYSYGVDEPENKKQAMGPFITGGTFSEDPSEYVNTETYEAVLSGGKYVVAEKGSLNAAISAADISFDSVKVGYTQPAEKIVTIKNDGQRDVTLNLPTSEKYDIALSANTLKSGETVDLTIQPKENLPVGNYAETITVTTNEGAETTFKVSFLVYQPSSGGSSKPVEEPVEPEIPEEPEVPTEEPEAGEVTVETEVTDGGEVEFEAPVEEPEAGEVGTPAAEDEAKITGVVLPTGTDSEVTFVPVSEQPAPAGKETQTKKVFEINVPTYEKGKAAVIKFTMTVAELAADGKEAADVALWHFDEETGEWTKLVTSYTIVDGVVYFEAITNDFSPFAIVYEDEPVDEPVDEPETPASPAPVIGLIAALGAAVVLRRK